MLDSGGDGQPREAPLEHPVGQSLCLAAVEVEQPDGVVGEDAVGAAAVGHDLSIVGKLGKPVGELVEGDADRARDMPGRVLLGWAHIEHGHVRGLGQLLEFGAGDRLTAVLAQVGDSSGCQRRDIAFTLGEQLPPAAPFNDCTAWT
jgi:hypothetical protein